MMVSATPVSAQLSDAAQWAAQAVNQFRIVPNITYLTANNVDLKLDLYTPREAKQPVPTLVYIHGGGWVQGSKETDLPFFLPYLEMGWAVVNVEYRLARVSLAPAAVEDCRCALRWVWKNAKEYNLDTARIVVTGGSAGGHLALMTGILPESAGLDRECYPSPGMHVAAIINWYGITDVAELLDGENVKDYAVKWLGSLPDREAIARRVSPLTYVRPGVPPVFTIHGDADHVVPYTQALRLQKALNAAGVTNQLYTVKGGGHGGFSREQMVAIMGEVRRFLAREVEK